MFTVAFQAAGAEDTFSVFNGPGICLTLGGRIALKRGQALVLACTAGLSNPADYNAAGEFCRIGAAVSGSHPGSSTRSYCGATLERQNGPVRRVAGIYCRSGTAALFGTSALADDTFFTTKTEIEVSFTHDLVCSFRFRKVGAAVWTAGAASQTLHGMTAQQVWFGVGHGICNNVSNATIEDVSIRIE